MGADKAHLMAARARRQAHGGAHHTCTENGDDGH
jgi:hypothetical protein